MRKDKWLHSPSREEESKIENKEEVPKKKGHISQEQEQHASQGSQEQIRTSICQSRTTARVGTFLEVIAGAFIAEWQNRTTKVFWHVWA